ALICNILLSLITLLLGQTANMAYKLSRKLTIHFVFLCMILSISYKAIILEKIMHQPKQWCETLECFVNSRLLQFLIPTDNIAYNELKMLHHLEDAMNQVKKKLL